MTQDQVLPFQLEHSNMRGRVVRLTDTLDRILRDHAYPTPVAGLVAEAVLLTALIGEAMDLRWRLSLQIRGEGAVRLIATDYYAPAEPGGVAQLRAYAGFDRDSDLNGGFDLMGRGIFGMTIDQGPGMTPYQGMVPLSGGSLGASAEVYFAQSEQIATRFVTLAGQDIGPGGALHWRAGGLMLQQMPHQGGIAPEAPSGTDGLMTGDDVAAMGVAAEDWLRTTTLLGTVEAHELVGPMVGMDQLLLRLFHEERPRVFAAQPVDFGCACSPDRVRLALSQYSAKDIGHMTTPEGLVTADCQFCGAHYDFDPATLGFEARGSAL